MPAPYLGGMIMELSGRGAMVRALAAADLATAAGDAALGPLPEWDLGDLYPGRDSPELARDLSALAADATAFRARYDGWLADLSGGELGAAVAAYEKLQEIGGRDLTEPEAMHLLSDRDGAVRKEAALGIGEVFGRNARLFGLITNTLAKDKEVEDRWRGFPRPISSRNLSNFVEDEVVDALIAAVRRSYPDLSHRYYRLKARWFGVEQLPFWDSNAPLPEDDDRTISWPEAENTVLSAYRAFSPELAAIGEPFFERRWIDARLRPGKAPGAFAHPTVPSAHPYLLLNSPGRWRVG